MVYKDICTKRSYKDSEGKDKAKWFKIGTYKVTDEGKEFIELNMFPNTPFYVFEQKKDKDEGSVDLA